MPPEAGVEARALDRLRSELRTAEPDNCGYLLRRQGLIPIGRYWLYLKNGRSRLVSSALIIVVSVALWSGMQFMLSGESEWMTTYHQWRLLKVTSTERDRFRTYATLRDRIRDAVESMGTSGIASDAQRARIRSALAPVIASLKYKELAARQCDDILRLVVDVHATPVEEVLLPDLVDALRTENSYSRAAVQKVLVGLQKADYPGPGAALPARGAIIVDAKQGRRGTDHQSERPGVDGLVELRQTRRRQASPHALWSIVPQACCRTVGQERRNVGQVPPAISE